MKRLLVLVVFFCLPCVAMAEPPKAGPAGWIPLFNGKDLTGWQDGAGKPVTKWKVENGELVWQKGCGTIWTVDRYGDFVLDLEFNLAPKTNSGVFLRCDSLKNWLHTAFEVQVLDSPNPSQLGKHDCGALYDVQAPSKQPCKPAGQWNHYVITFRSNKLEVEFNGVKSLVVDLDAWTEPGKNPDGTKNKFKLAYAKMAREGFIGLQDHGGALRYRNLKIKPLGK